MDQQLRGAYLFREMSVTGRPLFNALSGNYICTGLVPDMLVIRTVSDNLVLHDEIAEAQIPGAWI
jgi:hypothetical protein